MCNQTYYGVGDLGIEAWSLRKGSGFSLDLGFRMLDSSGLGPEFRVYRLFKSEGRSLQLKRVVPCTRNPQVPFEKAIMVLNRRPLGCATGWLGVWVNPEP